VITAASAVRFGPDIERVRVRMRAQLPDLSARPALYEWAFLSAADPGTPLYERAFCPSLVRALSKPMEMTALHSALTIDLMGLGLSARHEVCQRPVLQLIGARGPLSINSKV
jgi:hypothetical protein